MSKIDPNGPKAIEVEVIRRNIATGVTVTRRVSYSARSIEMALEAVTASGNPEHPLVDLLKLAGIKPPGSTS